MTDNTEGKQPAIDGSDNKIISSEKAGEKEQAPAPEAPAAATDQPRNNHRGDNNDVGDLKVKAEFIKQISDSSEKEHEASNATTPAAPAAKRDMRDEEGGGSNRRKKNRGMNRKRPRDERAADNDKICLSILRGEVCKFGEEKCRFSHDIKAYLASRPPDIQEVEGGCPSYKLTGFCIYGVMCRLGSCHLNMSTGENIKRDDVVPPPPIINTIPKDVLNQLRKKQYPFKCKRHFEKDNSRPSKDKKVPEKGEEKNDVVMKEQAKDDVVVKKEEKKDVVVEEEDKKDDAVKEEDKKDVAVKEDGMKEEVDKKDVVAKEEGMDTVQMNEPEAAAEVVKPSSAPVDLSPLPQMRKLIDFSNKVYVAPLTTVGNLPFRRIMKRFGADITCGEMAVATSLLEGKPSEWALLKRHPDEDVFGIQLAAGFADVFTRTSELIENHVTVDFVDLNLGCPLDLVCNKGAGAALMMRDKKLHEALDGMKSTLSCPITIKMRTGWDIDKPIAHSLVRKIQSWGIDGVGAIMVHGRSRLQRYSKLANWDYISELATKQDPNYTKIPVIGNGDIFSFTDYEEKVAREGVSATAMIARGALIKPWLPTEIKERRHWDISASERMDILKQFVYFGLEHWGSDQQGVNNTRRYLLEWLSFLYRYVPVGMIEVLPQQLNQRPPRNLSGRSDLETLFLSSRCSDWIKISEMLLGPVPEGFQFEPKHKARSYD